MVKVALYCRVSTEEQTTQNQEFPLIEWAQKKIYDYDLFRETASGSKQKRTELDKLMFRLRKGDYLL